MSLEILKKYNIKAKKSLWQNFLINDDILENIVKSINIKWKNIIEVWPGYWALTKKILEEKPKKLDLVELDISMINILNDRIKNWELDINWVDFRIKNIDILKYEPQFASPPATCPIPGRGESEGGYSVIANIPYYITSPILRHFLYKISKKPDKMVILMQKDVWDRILWFWKNKSSVLSLFIGKKCRVKELLLVWKENFIPEPKVESSVLLFEKHDLYNDVDDEKFLKIIKIWFSEPRKKLIKNIIKSWIEKEYITQVFNKLLIENNKRWEDLDIAKWCELVKEFNI
jgi:16S rRNA (adenine1518-N6/adenine1519-N6)-dimethyltransferase